MKRKYITDLKQWLEDPNRKPLILWGARQVGKSYLKKFFINYIINKIPTIPFYNVFIYLKELKNK